MSNRRSGGFNNNNNNRGNRYFDNHGGGGGGGRVMQNNNRGSMGGMGNNHVGQQQGGWRQNSNQNRQSIGPQGGMNNFDNRQFQQHQQQQQMMNQQNQFQNQLSNAVLRNSVGPNPGMMSSFGGNQDQPVVMVLPQSQATGGMMGGNMNQMGNMGMSQNPFAAAVMNQQKPMQVIVGNLPPGLNPAAFGQQVLPAYGQGVGEQNMGMFGQQTQQGSNRFGRDNKISSDRGRIQRNQKVALVRRTDVNDRGRVTAPRGVAKKRNIVVREQYGDNKKPKPAINAAVARNRAAVLAVRKGMKPRRVKPVAGNKAAPKTDNKAKEAAKATPNGNVKAAEGEVKPATEASADAAAAPEEKKPSKYEEVPVEFLVCKICKKTSADATAFDTHLASKLHVNLLKILEEKFTKRAELLMYESKMCEDEVAVEMDRPRRAGKGPHGGKGNKHHCKMCDCNYTVNWGTHKQSVWHRTLKEFLHPNCRFCKSQFVHRRDWIEHILSVSHMKKLSELKAEGKLSPSDLESTSQEELFAVHIEVTKTEKPLNIVNFHSLGGREPLTDDVKDMLAGEKGEIVLPEGEIKIPEQYDENIAVGEDAVFAVGGSCCKVCRIYIQVGEQPGHCKSRQHFDSYVEYLKRVVKLREQKAEEERKAKEEAELKAKAEAEAAAKAAEEAAKAAAAAEKMEVEAAEKKEAAETKPASATSSPAKKTEQMEVEASAGQKPDELVVLEEADGTEAEKMEEDQPVAVETPATPAAKAVEPVKSTPATPSTPKTTTPQRGGQNNRGARGSPARGGRGGPNRGGGGFQRGGRGGQQQQTPARGTTPRVDSNMRGGRGGQARGGGGRGGARGSPGRGRGRGGW